MSRPSTPVKVPPSAATQSDATLDPDLRSQINSVLLKEGHIARIQDSLLHALNANQTDWPSAVQTRALSLLRSGEVTNFPALLKRVLEDIQAESVVAAKATNGKALNGDAKKVNGVTSGSTSLALPSGVVDEALKVTREYLDTVCELDSEKTQ